MLYNEPNKLTLLFWVRRHGAVVNVMEPMNVPFIFDNFLKGAMRACQAGGDEFEPLVKLVSQFLSVIRASDACDENSDLASLQFGLER